MPYFKWYFDWLSRRTGAQTGKIKTYGNCKINGLTEHQGIVYLMVLNLFRLSPLFFLLLAIGLGSLCLTAEEKEIKEEEKLLGYLIMKQLEHRHFIRKERSFNDEFSEDSFGMLLKRVDPQKRILLSKDVEKLSERQREIDDEIKTGDYVVPLMIGEMVQSNIQEIKKFTGEILEKGFDFNLDEEFETKPEKIEFCSNFKELKNRWRQHLKYQCLNRYLQNLEQEKVKKEADDALKKKKKTETSGEEEKKVKAEVKKTKKPEDQLNKAIERVRKNLELYFKRIDELTRQDHFSRYFNSLTATFDPHTSYMDPQSKEDFDIHMKKSLEGIGAVLQETDDGFTKVLRIVPGSASHRQGQLEAEDIILRVAQGEEGGEDVDITGMPVREVVKYIRGPKGTVVRLTIKKPDGTIQVAAITRDIVKLEDALAKSAVLKGDEGKDFGYIYLPDFYRDFSGKTNRSATRDVTMELKKLTDDGIDGLIFDLRSNGGGALEDARSIAGLFIERGPIVQVKNSYGMVRVLHDENRNVAYDGPMVVLVNQFSASASEIFAAAMQDYGRAIIIGSDKTHGKGTVQQLIPLDKVTPQGFRHHQFGSLKLTIQKFYRITGYSTQNEGVTPDIRLPDQKIYLESGERFLDFALPFDIIPSVRFKHWDHPLEVEPIRKLSEARVQKDEAFQIINERYMSLKKRYEDTIEPLSIGVVKKEREEMQKELDHFDEVMKKLNGNNEEEIKKIDDNDKLTEKQKEHIKWEFSLSKDPYVKESMHILTDMTKQLTSGMSLKTYPRETVDEG